MTVSVKAETQILLGLIALFAIGGLASFLLKAPPIITSVCVSLIVTACLYRFLGGVEGSRLSVASFKAGGSVAVCFAVAFYVNQQLVLQDRSISPDPSEWIALDRTGNPIDVRIGRTSMPADSNLLRDAVWRVDKRDGEIRVVTSEETLAKVDPESLQSIGFFNDASMADNRAIVFTGPLEQGKEANLYPPYPFWIRAS